MKSLQHWAETWGSSVEERAGTYPCDELLEGGNAACYRAITIDAPEAIVFRWLCQLRIAPYSYDWIDNLGRRSPRRLTPGLDALAVGQPVMRIFDLAGFDVNRHLTLRLRHPGVFPPMLVSYVVTPHPPLRCRLVVKLLLRFRPGVRDRIVRGVLPWLDLIMMRRQLLNIRALSERTGGNRP